MDIRQMRYVLAVVDTGTFTAAAARLFVAQPSLSQSIAKLERELGVELFQRIGRMVSLTAAGEAFVAGAREAVRAFDAVKTEIDAVAGVLAGHLDLVALPTLALDPMASLVGRFRDAYPQVLVRLAHPDGNAHLLRSVRVGDNEIGLTEKPSRREGADLVVRSFGRQEIVATAPPGWPRRRRLRAARLGDVPLVTQPQGTSTRALLDRALGSRRATAQIAVETDQREALIPLVMAGAGVALLPRSMAEQAGAQGAVLSSLDPPLWRELALVHREGRLSPAGRAFVDLALEGR